jgi:hypothetical protein
MGNQEAVMLHLMYLGLSYMVVPVYSVISFRCCEVGIQKVIFAYIRAIQGSGILNFAGLSNLLGPQLSAVKELINNSITITE